MASILNTTDIISKALEIVRDQGPDRLTARVLASDLFVAPATLYNYVDSMDAIQEMVEEQVLDELISEVDFSTERSAQAAVLRWLRERPNYARLVLDPTRSHSNDSRAKFLALFAEECPWIDSTTFEDLRGASAVASLLWTDDDLDSFPSQAPRLRSAYLAALEQTTANIAQIADPTDRAISLIGADSSVDETRRLVRSATARINGRGEPWSFQGMANETGLSVGKLHRLGNRQAHLNTYAGDWFRGASDLARTETNNALEALCAIPPMFVQGGLSREELSDIWRAQDPTEFSSFVDLCGDAIAAGEGDRTTSPRIVASTLLGYLVARVAGGARTDEERLAVGTEGALIARALIAATDS